jgi:hypothetical protein
MRLIFAGLVILNSGFALATEAGQSPKDNDSYSWAFAPYFLKAWFRGKTVSEAIQQGNSKMAHSLWAEALTLDRNGLYKSYAVAHGNLQIRTSNPASDH